MRASRTTRAVLFAAAITSAAALSACTAGDTDSPRDDALAQAFSAALAETSVPGGVVAVHRDGQTEVYPAGVADEDGTAVTEDTVFAYRSVTKSFVTTVILQLAEEGRLQLDDVLDTAGTGIVTDATVAQAATMTSGIASYSAQPGLIELIVEDFGRSWNDTTLYSLTAGVAETFAPGTSYEYSNTNTVLLGQSIIEASGTSWWEAVSDRITEPLGLTSVTYPDDAFAPAGAAAPFQLDGEVAEPLPAVRASAFSAAGGLFGTAADLAVWGEALGSGSLLTPESQRLRLDSLGPTADDPRSPFYDAYGFGLGRIGGWIGHTGNGLGYQALAMYHPESETSVAIVLNATGEDGDLPAHLLESLEAVVLASR